MDNLPFTKGTSIMFQIQTYIPQDVMTALATTLQDVYKTNQNGGHGSRRKVSQLLLELGLQPNKKERLSN